MKPAVDEAAVTTRMAHLHLRTGLPALARVELEEGRQIAREVGNLTLLSECLIRISMTDMVAGRYDAALAGLPVERLGLRPGCLPVWHLYPIRTERRDELKAHLAERGVETAIHYPTPLHLQPAYGFLGHGPGAFPVSEAACETVLSLPIYPTLENAQVDRVAGAVREFFS